MGAFLEPNNVIFTELSNIHTIILETDNTILPYDLTVYNVNVCNLGNQTIRINLQIQSTSTLTTTGYLEKEVELKPYETKNIIENLGSQFLKYSLSPSILNRLICFSNSPIQKFSCVVTFSALLETPIVI